MSIVGVCRVVDEKRQALLGAFEFDISFDLAPTATIETKTPKPRWTYDLVHLSNNRERCRLPKPYFDAQIPSTLGAHRWVDKLLILYRLSTPPKYAV